MLHERGWILEHVKSQHLMVKREPQLLLCSVHLFILPAGERCRRVSCFCLFPSSLWAFLSHCRVPMWVRPLPISLIIIDLLLTASSLQTQERADSFAVRSAHKLHSSTVCELTSSSLAIPTCAVLFPLATRDKISPCMRCKNLYYKFLCRVGGKGSGS